MLLFAIDKADRLAYDLLYRVGMSVVSPSKYASIESLESAKTDNYVGACGKEYVAEELELLLINKYQRKADANLRLWTAEKTSEEQTDGMLELLTEENGGMGIKIVDDRSSAEVLKAGLAVAPIGEATEALARIKAEAETARSEYTALRTQVFKATALAEEFEKQVKELSAKLSAVAMSAANGKIMQVEIDGIRHKLSKAAVPYLAAMITNAKLGINTMLVGPAGCGKTTAAEQLAEALGLEFGHVCFTAGASESWLFGRQTPNGFIEAPFMRLYRNGGVFLGDEMDAADPNTLLSINTALANGHIYNPINGEIVARHKDFVFIAACNTFGKGGNHTYSGRNRLDGASLDRFKLLAVTYDADLEKKLCPDETIYTLLSNARAKLTELRSSEIISTRAFDRVYRLVHQGGCKLVDEIESLTLSWSPDLVKQCGLDSKSVKAAEKEAKEKAKSDSASEAKTGEVIGEEKAKEALDYSMKKSRDTLELSAELL